MAVYDKNEKRVRAIRLQVERGTLSKEHGERKIKKISATGPSYRIKGQDIMGRTYDLAAPKGSTRKMAERLDEETRVKVRGHTFSHPTLFRTTLSDILDRYLKKKVGKGGYKAAATHCGHLKRVVGNVRFERLERDTVPLEVGFASLPEEWEQKTIWNVRATLRAAVGHFIKVNRLNIQHNPIDAFEVEKGTNVRHVYPTLTEHLALLERCRKELTQVTKRRGYPFYVQVLLHVGYEMGLRIGEILHWRWEDLDLGEYVPGAHMPFVRMAFEKGGALSEVPLPKPVYEALLAMPGNHDKGRVFPVKNPPWDLLRRLLNDCNLSHLRFHDYRRSWNLQHLDKPTEVRLAGQGKKSEAAASHNATYLVLKRKEMEALYRSTWQSS